MIDVHQKPFLFTENKKGKVGIFSEQKHPYGLLSLLLIVICHTLSLKKKSCPQNDCFQATLFCHFQLQQNILLLLKIQGLIIYFVSLQLPSDEVAPVQDAVLRVQQRIVMGVPDPKESTVLSRLIVASHQIGCLLGKGGAVITEIRKLSGAQVRILGKDQIPKGVPENYGMVQVCFDRLRLCILATSSFCSLCVCIKLFDLKVFLFFLLHGYFRFVLLQHFF